MRKPWGHIQSDLFPEMREELDPLTEKLERLIHILDDLDLEAVVRMPLRGPGRPLDDRAAIARAFVAKAVLGLTTTGALLERLQTDRTLRRICGWGAPGKLWRLERRCVSGNSVTGPSRCDSCPAKVSHQPEAEPLRGVGRPALRSVGPRVCRLRDGAAKPDANADADAVLAAEGNTALAVLAWLGRPPRS